LRRDGEKDGEREGVRDEGEGREGSCPGKGSDNRKRRDGKSRERRKDEKGEGRLGGAWEGMFHPHSDSSLYMLHILTESTPPN